MIIVDEIGTEEEAIACRTIAERGVQLVKRNKFSSGEICQAL